MEAWEDLARRLAVLVEQLAERNTLLDSILEDMRAYNAAQVLLNQTQVSINQDVSLTLARIETLLERVLRHETDGREA